MVFFLLRDTSWLSSVVRSYIRRVPAVPVTASRLLATFSSVCRLSSTSSVLCFASEPRTCGQRLIERGGYVILLRFVSQYNADE